MVEWLDTRLWTALDKYAPSKEKCITVRSSSPWFTDEIKEQKRRVRRREKIWRPYGSTSNWISLKTERQKYEQMFNDIKTQTICEKVADCNWDSKKLYSLVCYLIGTKMDNPLLEHIDDEKLVDDFADYFGEDQENLWQPCRSSKIQPSWSSKGITESVYTSFSWGCGKQCPC